MFWEFLGCFINIIFRKVLACMSTSDRAVCSIRAILMLANKANTFLFPPPSSHSKQSPAVHTVSGDEESEKPWGLFSLHFCVILGKAVFVWSSAFPAWHWAAFASLTVTGLYLAPLDYCQRTSGGTSVINAFMKICCCWSYGNVEGEVMWNFWA